MLLYHILEHVLYAVPITHTEHLSLNEHVQNELSRLWKAIEAIDAWTAVYFGKRPLFFWTEKTPSIHEHDLENDSFFGVFVRFV